VYYNKKVIKLVNKHLLKHDEKIKPVFKHDETWVKSIVANQQKSKDRK